MAARLFDLPQQQSATTQQASEDRWLLTTQQLAVRLGLSVRSIQRLNSTGRLPRPVRINGSVRFREDEIRAWVAAGCPSRKEWEAANPQHRKGGRS